MSLKDNFGKPSGLIGKIMLSGMNMGHTPMAKWGFTQIEVPRDGKCADIGCGGGYNVKRLLERSGTGIVYGVDYSEASCKKTESVNKKYLGTRCKVFQASAEKLPFKDGTLDLVTAFETIYFWPDIQNCFVEVKRVLKDGGKFAVINDTGDPDKNWADMIPGMTAYTSDDVAKLMKNAGFSDIVISASKYKYCVQGTASKM